jgi:hypothetical protein
MIGDRYVAATIDHISTINLISIEVVETLHQDTRASAAPYLLRSSYGTLLISHIADIPVTYRGHTKVIHCGVSPMPLESCHILLGYPWFHTYHAQPCRDRPIVFYLLVLYLLALPNTPENPFASIYSESLIKTACQFLD